MATGKIRFYRGTQGTPLPETHLNGAIFVLERSGTDDDGYGLGDMYVDMNEGKRLHIIPDNHYIIYNDSMSGQPSTPGTIYIVMENNNQIGVKIGDSGNAYIGDLPTYHAVSLEEKEFWNQKVNAYLGTEYTDNNIITEEQRTIDNLTLPDNNLEETLVLSRELWF